MQPREFSRDSSIQITGYDRSYNLLHEPEKKVYKKIDRNWQQFPD